MKYSDDFILVEVAFIAAGRKKRASRSSKN